MARIIIASDFGAPLEVEQSTYDAGFFPGYVFVGPAPGGPPILFDPYIDAATAAAAQYGTQLPAALKAASGTSLPQFHGIRYAAYGHSFGQVQSPANTWAGSLYPARLRDLLRADTSLYANRTVNGRTMDAIATDASSSWTSGNYGLVSLLGNQNSAGFARGQSAFQADVRSFLNVFLAQANPPTILVVQDTTCTSTGYARYSTGYNDAVVAQYNQWLVSVVNEFPTAPIVVANPIGDGWNPATMTCPDGQHPNDRGQAHITASCLKALAAASYREGLNLGIAPAPPDTTAPSVPTGLAVSGTPTSTSVALTWTASTDSGGSGVAGYRVFRNGSGTALNSTLIAGTSYTDGTVSASTTYTYTVAAVDNAGNQSAVSTAVSATTPAGSPPTAPTRVAATNQTTGTSVALSVATQANDLLLFFAITDDYNIPINAPTGGTGVTWSSVAQVFNVAGRSAVYCWKGTATTTETATINAATYAATVSNFSVQVWRGSAGVGSSVTVSSGSTPQATLTTAAHSAITVAIDDFNVVDGTSRAYLTTVGTPAELYYEKDGTLFTGYVAAYPDAGTAGSKTVGLTAPTGMQPTVIAVEILGK